MCRRKGKEKQKLEEHPEHNCEGRPASLELRI